MGACSECGGDLILVGGVTVVVEGEGQKSSPGERYLRCEDCGAEFEADETEDDDD